MDFMMNVNYLSLITNIGMKRYSSKKIWQTFQNVFNYIPISAIIDEKILCMHGGLSPDLEKIEQIKQIKRPTEIPPSGLLCDLLWSDPDIDIVNDFQKNERGISFSFSKNVINRFLKNNQLDLICRGHQVN